MKNSTSEREQLVATVNALTDEQYNAETLCTGWDAGDLMAHLLVREREPVAAPGIVIGGPFARITAKRMRARKARGRERMLAQLATGPPRWLTFGPLDDSQAVEDWIHHEDIRRGAAGLSGRITSPQMSRPLWLAVKRFARLTLAKTPAKGVVALTDGSRTTKFRVGPDARFALKTDGEADATVTGSAGEMALFVTGRPSEVEISGGDAMVGALKLGPGGM